MPQYYLTEEDRDAIRGLVRFAKSIRTRANAVGVDWDEHQAPEVYIAYTSAGISEMSGLGTGSSTADDAPGKGSADIYAITSADLLAPINKSVVIYNLSSSAIPAESWIIASRDKAGKWLAIAPGLGGGGGGSLGDSNFNYDNYVNYLLYSISQNCPGDSTYHAMTSTNWRTIDGGAGVVLTFPSTGIWQVDSVIYSHIDLTPIPASGTSGEIWLMYQTVNTVSEMLTPENTPLTGVYYLQALGAYNRVDGSGNRVSVTSQFNTFSMLIKVLTAGTEALVLSGACVDSSGGLSGYIGGATSPERSYLRGLKIGQL